jgi:imidazolonepropionase
MSTKTYFNIKQLLSLEGVDKKEGRKITRDDLGIYEDCYLVTENGLVKEIGTGKASVSDENIDLRSTVVLPAFVDSHTHITFLGSRSNEFEMRSEGKTYIEIAKAGGGIISTVNKTRKASIDELYQVSLKNIQRLKSFGVGLIEAKTGYGLDEVSEMKQLEAINMAKKDYPLLIPTFLGAHDIPPVSEDNSLSNKQKRKEEFIELIIKRLIPKIGNKKLAKFCDVFVEEGYYTREEAKLILNEAKKHGMIPKLHVDEFTNQEGACLAVELGAASADHLLCISNNGIDAISKSSTVACVLPGTSFNLGLPYAPAKKLIEAGACLAIGSDFNPGSNNCLNMQLIMTIAISQMKISIAQAISAACYGGAKSLMLEKEFGSLTRGKKAVFQSYSVNSYQDIFYNYGENNLKSLFNS